MHSKYKNFELIGKKNSRNLISTPSLILDYENLKNNISKMAGYVKDTGMVLRPHSKTHKMPKISKLQIQKGALGVCVATTYEAEIMEQNGVSNILLTTPVTNKENLKKLIPIINNDNLTIVIDDTKNLDIIHEILHLCKKQIKILVDIDIMSIGTDGIGRTGARSFPQIISIIEYIKRSKSLKYEGVSAYAGDLQHINSYSERKRVSYDRYSYLSYIIESLKEKTFSPKIISGGGTGTHVLDINSKIFTELQPGSYIFNDLEYDAVELDSQNKVNFETSLFVKSTIISSLTSNNAILDAGIKAFSCDSKLLPKISSKSIGETNYKFFGDEHGLIEYGKKDAKIFYSGAAIELNIPHCDPTVNLYDSCHIVSDNVLIDIWPIEARGYGN